MKWNFYDSLRKVQLAFLTLTAIFPIAPWLYCENLPDSWALHWVFTGLAFFFAACCMLAGKKIRSVICILGILTEIALGVVLLPGKASGMGFISVMAVPVLYSVALLFIRPMAEYPPSKEPPGYVYLAGVLLYPVWHITMASLEVKEIYIHSPAKVEMLILFLLFLALVMFSRNRGTLDSASQGRFYMPPSIQRVNWLLISVLVGVIVLLGAFPVVGKLLAFPITALISLFSGAVDWLWNHRAEGYVPSAMPTASQMLNSPLLALMPNTGESVKPPDVLMWIFAFVVLGIFIFVIVMIIIRLVRLLLKTVEKVLHSTDDGEAEYQEELTDVRDTATSLKPKVRTLKEILNDRKPDEPGAQIRYRYKVLKRRHPKWRSSETVRQQLSQEAAGLYERIRYGGKDASAEDAQNFEAQTKGL